MSRLNREKMYESLKDHNRSLILRQLCFHGARSLNRLSELTDLSRSSVVNYVNALKDDGLVSSAGLDDSTGGRRQELWRLNPGSKWFVGVSLANGVLRWTIADLNRGIVREGTKTPVSESQGDIVKGIGVLLQKLKHMAADAGADFEDACVAVKGVVHPHAGIIFSMDEYPDWRDLPLTQLWDYDFDVHLINYPSAALLRDKWFSKSINLTPTACFFLGNLLQVGVIRDGAVIRGEIGTDIDIGHVTVDPDGLDCHCGRKGCFLTVATRANHDRRVAEAKTPEARANVERELMDRLAMVIDHVKEEFGVDNIIVGGYPADMDEPFRDSLKDVLKDPRLLFIDARSEGEIMARGAAFRSLENFLNMRTFKY